MVLAPHDQDQLENWFTYHPPTADDVERMREIREGAKTLAELITELCPASADRTAAIRKLRECVMTANASIVCRGK